MFMLTGLLVCSQRSISRFTIVFGAVQKRFEYVVNVIHCPVSLHILSLLPALWLCDFGKMAFALYDGNLKIVVLVLPVSRPFLLKYRNKILIPTYQLSVGNKVGKPEILQTYNKSEEIVTVCPVFFLQLLRFCTNF